jgi:ABC-type transport system involved in multi-copper enzyme maturation permease subunit
MWRTIVRKEILENIFSYRFPLFAALCLLLIPLGLYVNGLGQAKAVRDYNEQMRLAEEAVSGITMQDLMAGAVSVKGFRRPAPLSILSQGLENALPRYYEFTPDGSIPGESAGGEASILSAQGKIDFIFLVQMVISLVALLFASDVIAGEKEAGTLRAMLSNSLPRDAVLMGKITGGFIALWLPFLAACLLGTVLLLVGAFPLFDSGTPVRIAIVFLCASLFLLIYFGLGTMVSAGSPKTRTSLVTILLVWVLFQLVVPKVSDMIAGLVYPIRTETQVSLERSLLAKTIGTETSKELGRRYVAIFGPEGGPSQGDKPTPEDEQWGAAKDEIERRGQDRKALQIAQIDDAYGREKRTQRAIAAGFSLVSPSAALARLLADLSGTGELARRRYEEAVRNHQLALDTALFGKAKRTVIALPGGRTSLSFSMQPVDVKALPKFSIAPATLAEIFKENLKSLLSLAFWLIVPFAVAYVRFLRYDVR